MKAVLAGVLLILLPVLTAALAHSRHSRHTGITFSEERRSGCSDWAGRGGHCTTIYRCPAMLHTVLNVPSSPARTRNLQNIRNSVCGLRDTQYLICCAAQSAVTEPPVTKPSVIKPPVTDPPVTEPAITDPPVTEPAVTDPPVTEASPSEVSESAVTEPRAVAEHVTEPTTEGVSSEPLVEQTGTHKPPCDNCTDAHPNSHLLPQGDGSCGRVLSMRIVGGTVVQIGRHPWLAAVGYKVVGSEEVEYRCGGSLINERYVLTAAHCVTKLPPEFTVSTIRLGEHDLDSEKDCMSLTGGEELCADPPQDFDIEELIPHVQYDSPIRLRNDIALIRLSRPAIISAFVTPVCLPVDQLEESFAGERPWAVGFGLTSARGESSAKLLEVRLPVLAQEECVPIFRRRADIGPTQLCAGGERLKDSCSGDSGGPLVGLSLPGRVEPFVQIGVVSFGSVRCGTKNVPGIYTRVTEYLDWILDHMRE